jgi:hypothetical protein
VEERIAKALEVAGRFGTTDGAHHKQWVIDQMVRALTGEDYNRWVAEACNGEEGPNTYDWETGTPP